MFCACAWGDDGQPVQQRCHTGDEYTETPLFNRDASPLMVSAVSWSRHRRLLRDVDGDMSVPAFAWGSLPGCSQHCADDTADEGRGEAIRAPRAEDDPVGPVQGPPPPEPTLTSPSTSSLRSKTGKNPQGPPASLVGGAAMHVDDTSAEALRHPEPTSLASFMPIGPAGASVGASAPSTAALPTTPAPEASGGTSPASSFSRSCERANNLADDGTLLSESSTPGSAQLVNAMPAAAHTKCPGTSGQGAPSAGLAMNTRCTARDPFWVYAKDAAMHPTVTPAASPARPNGVAALPVAVGPRNFASFNACLQDAVLAVDKEWEVEVPESEIMTVQLRTREQRLDWRDFLCEAVAGRRTATLFNKFDVEAEPPEYARPPPSAISRLPRAAEQSMRPDDGIRCVAPNGAGWNSTPASAHHHLADNPRASPSSSSSSRLPAGEARSSNGAAGSGPARSGAPNGGPARSAPGGSDEGGDWPGGGCADSAGGLAAHSPDCSENSHVEGASNQAPGAAGAFGTVVAAQTSRPGEAPQSPSVSAMAAADATAAALSPSGLAHLSAGGGPGSSGLTLGVIGTGQNVVEELLDGEMRGKMRICIIGGSEPHCRRTEELVGSIAQGLSSAFCQDVVFITKGNMGVQADFARRCDASTVLNLVPGGNSSAHGIGRDIHVGASWEQRDKVFSQIGHVCLVAEAGEKTAAEARAAFTEGQMVLPLALCGRDTSGQYGFPLWALERRLGLAAEEQWDLLWQADAPVQQSAAAATAICEAYFARLGLYEPAPALAATE